MYPKALFSCLLLFLVVSITSANNIQTSNVNLSGQNTTSHFSMVNFDISWENSWRTSTNEKNYDGCWIFAKFRKVNTSLWQHCTINYVSPGTPAACGHTAASGATLQTAADGKGLFMYRSADGIGNVSWAGNSIRWNYGTDGVLDADSVEIRLYAVEMVYIPQGAFYLGSGSTTEAFRFRDGAADTYLSITSENDITVGTGAGQLFGYGTSNMAAGTIPAAYPKGYKAFWIMKHELSQQCYVDFLNTLDLTGASTRNMGGFTGSHPNLVAPFPERAMNSIGTIDYLAWTDWAAMRPFTEMEYEKACRGSNILPIANEYAWGNTTITQISGMTDAGTPLEAFTSGNCNYYYSTIGRTVRVGSIANTSSTRVSSGATYYGVMEMSGNVWERAIAAGYADGRNFTGSHGDGKLSIAAEHNQATWPLNTTGSGLTWRGAAYNNASLVINLQTSDRTSASITGTTRIDGYGGRTARTAE